MAAPQVAATRALRAFAAAHGGSASAVVERLGRTGVRVVAIGADGRWGDVVLPDDETARRAIEAAGLDPVDGWDRDTSAALRGTAYEWARMGSGHAGRRQV